MMLVITCLIAVTISTTFADDCTDSNCRNDNNCVCPSKQSPLTLQETPQFVVLTFDDAVTEGQYEQFYKPYLIGKSNNDGSPISGTFFVPHEYSDYEMVNNLYNAGFEIGVNSISKNGLTSYWSEANEQTLIEEFGGDRELVAHFANIPIDSIKGARTPNLQLRGNITFDAYSESGLTYDNSWPTQTSDLFFPYTLDYLSPQHCAVGFCPNASFPGFWVAPILNLQGMDGIDCNVLLGCNVSGSTEELLDWFKEQFDRTYLGNKAPLPLLLNSAWFQFTDNSLDAALLFLDYLTSLDDVFLVSVSQVIDWMQNPITLAEYKPNIDERNADCSPRMCVLDFSETEIRYMKSCVGCPAVYPWLGNPLGEAS